jgi:hypothetical protein
MYFKIWRLRIFIGFSKCKPDSVVREEAKKMLKKWTLESKGVKYTSMSLHYKDKKNDFINCNGQRCISQGTMFI